MERNAFLANLTDNRWDTGEEDLYSALMVALNRHHPRETSVNLWMPIPDHDEPMEVILRNRQDRSLGEFWKPMSSSTWHYAPYGGDV